MQRMVGPAGFALAAMVYFCPAFADDQPTNLTAFPREYGKPALRSWGTGFLVDRDGHVLTARHNIADCTRIEIVGPAGRVPAAIVATSVTDDLGLLSSPLSGEPIALDPDGHVPGGAFVTVFSYPGLSAARRQHGSQIQFNGVVLSDDMPRHIALVADTKPGSSGSPVMDVNGLVVGVIESEVTRVGLVAATAWPRDISLAVSASAAAEFLRLQRIAVANTAEKKMPQTAPLDRLAAAEVEVECHGTKSGS